MYCHIQWPLGCVGLLDCGVEKILVAEVSFSTKNLYNLTSLIVTVVNCGDPPNIDNGSRTFTLTTFGETATYTCDGIFVLSGTAILTCNGDGSWGDPPTCSRKTEILILMILLSNLINLGKTKTKK